MYNMATLRKAQSEVKCRCICHTTSPVVEISSIISMLAKLCTMQLLCMYSIKHIEEAHTCYLVAGIAHLMTAVELVIVVPGADLQLHCIFPLLFCVSSSSLCLFKLPLHILQLADCSLQLLLLCCGLLLVLQQSSIVLLLLVSHGVIQPAAGSTSNIVLSGPL